MKLLLIFLFQFFTSLFIIKQRNIAGKVLQLPKGCRNAELNVGSGNQTHELYSLMLRCSRASRYRCRPMASIGCDHTLLVLIQSPSGSAALDVLISFAVTHHDRLRA